MMDQPGENQAPQESGDVTRLLNALSAGQAQAAEEILPLVYQELRRLAAWKMAHEPAGQTLQPTALVHEAWLRLVSRDHQNWQNRNHFMAAASEAMRRILVDQARRKQQVKRGGDWLRVDWEGLDLAEVTPDEKILLVHEALDELARLAPKEAEVVKLHVFVGLDQMEIAQILNLSQRTVKRYWAFAKVWLFRYMEEHR